MRKLISVCLVLVLGASPVFPQDKAAAPQEGDRIRVFTRLVQVPVTVTDGSGKLVTDLTADDFMLSEEGKEQKIATFENVTTVNTKIGIRNLEPGLHTNRLIVDGGSRAVVVMVLDTINTPITDQAYTKQQMIKYLTESVQPGTLLSIRVMSRTGVRVVTDFTTDTSLLIAALQRAKNDPLSPTTSPDPGTSAPLPTPTQMGFIDMSSVDPMYASLQAMTMQTDPQYESFQRGIAYLDTFSGIRGVAQSLAGIPGRKAIIWATAGFPLEVEDTRGFSSNLYKPYFGRMIQELNDLNVSLYPVDARGLLGNLSMRASEFFSNTRGSNVMQSTSARASAGFGVGSPQISSDPMDAMRYMADLTGGIAYVNTNDLATSFKRAAEDSSSYYLLGYYLTRNRGSAPEFRKVKVQVKRPGLKVRTRQGVYVSPRPADVQGAREADLGLAQRSQTNLTGLGLMVDWLPDPAKPQDPTKFYIQVNANDITVTEPENLMSVEFLAVARGKDGKLIDQVAHKVEGKVKSPEDFRKQPMLYSNNLKPLPPGAVVRFIVRDNLNGRLGSVIVDTATMKK